MPTAETLSADGLQSFMRLQDAAVEAVGERFCTEHAALCATFDSLASELTRQDIALHLELLRAVLEFGMLRPMVDYLCWRGSVLAARAIQSDHLALSLDWLAEFFAAHMDATAGGSVAAVLRGVRAQFIAAGAATTAAPATPEPWPQTSIFEAALLAGKQREALALMTRCLDAGQSLVDFELHVIEPALSQIGQKWETHQISVAQEHMATAIAHSVMSVGLLRSPPPAPNGKRLLLACVEGNHHSVGLRMLANGFQLAGWDVQYLGANVPSAAVVAQVLEWKPHLVGLSLSFAQQMSAARAVIAQLRDRLGSSRPPIIIGGRAFKRGDQLAAMTQADAFGDDSAAARARTELDPLLAVVAATIAADGRLQHGNAGFLRLIGVNGPAPIELRVACHFIQPDFASLIASPADGSGQIHSDLLTMVDANGLARSLRARIWRSDSGLRLLAEYAIEDIERLTATVRELNGDYAAMQAELTQTHFSLRQANAQLAQREAALAASDAQQRAIIEAAPVPLAMSDAQGHIVVVNKAFVEQLGYTQADIPTRSDWWRLACPDAAGRPSVGAAWEDALGQLVGNGEPFATLEATFTCKDQSRRTFIVRAALIGGPPASHLIALEDVTDRRRDEAQLARYRGHLEALVDERTAALQEASRTAREIQQAMDGAGICIRWVDLDSGRILHVNDCAAEALGYSVEHMLGLNIADIDPSADAAMLGQLRIVLAAQGRFQFESCNRRRDGSDFPVEAILYYGAATAEMPAHSIAFVHDISERKAAESALAAANAAVEATRRASEERLRVESEAKMESRKLEALGTLAAGIAHDFNNSLGSIVGFAEMTADELADDSKGKSNIAQILKASFRARDLIARMLTFARQSPADAVTVDFAEQVREALALLRGSLRPAVQLSFHSGIATAAPLTIRADPTQIQQIVMNLCINAAHAIPDHGTIRVGIYPSGLIDGAPAKLAGDVCLTVADSGSGMSADVLERMFDPFFTTKASGKGSGLGLSVVHGIVKDLGGLIEAKSRSSGDDTGTEFRVFLPATTSGLPTGTLPSAPSDD